MPLAPPRIGEERDGYRFVGGDPASENSWIEKASPLASLNWQARGASYLPRRTAKTNPSTEAGFEKWKIADNPATAAARSSRATMLRAEGLLNAQEKQGQKTGSWINNTPVLKDINAWVDPEIRELDAIQARAARQERQPGEGAISDFDAQQFITMSYGKDKPLNVNRSLIRANRMRSDMQIEHRAFQEWFKSTYGNSNGAAEAWDRYAQDNTIFDPASEANGTPVLNAKRQTWRQYFGAERGEGDRRPSGMQEDIRRSAPKKPRQEGASGAAWRRLATQGVITGKGGFGSPTNPYRATTWEVHRKLPKGSYYIDPDGNYGIID